jgi:hypothetical protein
MNDDTTTVDYFGGCPTCGKNDGYLNAGRTHVFYCREHKVSWIFGANMFSSWKDETEEEQREKYKLIEDFERVEPLWPENANVVFSRAGTALTGRGMAAIFQRHFCRRNCRRSSLLGRPVFGCAYRCST